jgi:carboxyl-terminal processing protease
MFAFPDVCNTPQPAGTVPIPYPNFGAHATATGFSTIVKVTMVNALNLASSIPSTTGDEAGCAGPFKGKGSYTVGNPIVFIEGLPAVTLTTPTMQNGANAVGAVLVPDLVNVFFTHAAARALDAASFAELAAVASGAAPALEVSPREGALLIRVLAFTSDLAQRVLAALAAGEARALVLDLRGCPGGDLEAALRLAGCFLPRGALLAEVRDAEGTLSLRAAATTDAIAIPLVLLVDGGTASAAEVLAAALQHHARALVIGRRTYGKGTAQVVASGDSGLAVSTVAVCAGPGGEPIEGAGVTPDVPLDTEGDAAVEAALLIAGALAG